MSTKPESTPPQSGAATRKAEFLEAVAEITRKAAAQARADVRDHFSPLLAEVEGLFAAADPIPRPPFASHRTGRKARAIRAVKTAASRALMPFHRFLFQRQAELNHRVLLVIADLLRRLSALADRTAFLGQRVVHWSDQVRAAREEGTSLAGAMNALQGELQRLSTRMGACEREWDSEIGAPSSASYYAFENQFRGSEDDIHARISEYVGVLGAVPGRLLDIGCGRGELVELARNAGLDAAGIDVNELMVARCRSKGLPVEHANAFDYLAEIPDGKLGAITAIQVVEHFSSEDLERFLKLAFAKLAPGGKILLETINPHCLSAMRYFFADPTHRTLVYPEILEWSLGQHGFTGARTVRVHPVDPKERLALPEDPALRPAVERLNEIFYGPQDFYAVATRPGKPSP